MRKLKSNIILAVFALATIACVSFASPIASDSSKQSVSIAKAVVATALAITLIPVMVSFTAKRGAFGFNAYFDAVQEMPFTVAQKALWDFLMTEGDPSTQLSLKKKELLIVSYAESLKFQVAISSTGKIELLNQTAAYRQGRIPMEYNQGVLPKGFNLAISKIRAAYGTDAALLPEAIANYTTVAGGWPAALQHGQFIISQNGVYKEQFTGRVAGSAAASFGPGIDGDGYELQSPMILEEGKPMKIELFTPNAVAFPATPAILAVAVEFIGAAVRPRS